MLSTLEVVGDAQHFVGGLNAFGVCFKRSLRGENLHHRVNDGHVRFFEHAEADFRAVRGPAAR